MIGKIAVAAGDGIGPEITEQGVRVLEAVSEKFGHRFEFDRVPVGGCAIDLHGTPLPDGTLKACRSADAVLFGAVGGPKWDALPPGGRPESALLALRKGLGLYANLRPSRLHRTLADACPLRPDIRDGGIDLLIVRELTGGLYFGPRGTDRGENGETHAFDTLVYSEGEIARIAETAFKAAMGRRKKLVSVDKANVLDTSRLWRSVLHETAKRYPEVRYSDMLVDNCAMQLMRDPSQFDVIVTENMFGDILSDEASMLTGSIGLIPSASLGEGAFGLYEPIHGSAPDIAGQNAADPIASVLSAAMLLRHSFGLPREARAVEDAVESALEAGFATRDIMSPGKAPVTCSGMGDEIVRRLAGT